jgi:hypothetical protein
VGFFERFLLRSMLLRSRQNCVCFVGEVVEEDAFTHRESNGEKFEENKERDRKQRDWFEKN